MAIRSNDTHQSNRRGSRVNKKLKTEPIEKKQNPQDSIPQPSSSDSASSASSSDEDSNETNTQNKDDGPTSMHDEPSTQSFSDRLKILNLQTEPSNEPPESSDSAHQSQSDPEQVEEGPDRKGLATKLLKPKPRNKLNESFNGSSSIHPTTATIAPVGSLAQTLTQALKSNDTKLLESCFLQQYKSNKDLIAHTIYRLPKTLLHNLIEQIVICLNRKKRGYGDGATVATVRRTKNLIEWVRQILLIHMSYLLAVPTLASQLTTLHASLQKRLNLHNKLLSLNGRVRLILNQIEINKALQQSRQVPDSRPVNGISKSKRRQVESTSIPKSDPFKYAEEESSSSDEEEQKRQKRGTKVDDDDEESEESGGSDSGQDEDEDEGSVEEVVLRSGSDGDESGDSDGEDEPNAESDQNDDVMEDIIELEAEESQGEVGTDEDEEDDGDDDDDEEDDEDEDEGVDDSMEGFIDDRPLPSTEEDSDSDDD